MLPNYLNDIWTGLAVACYVLASAILLKDLDRSGGRAGGAVVTLLLVAAGAHAFTLIPTLFGDRAVNLGIDNALSLAAWVVVVLFLVALFRQRLATLGLIVSPYALICVTLDWWWSGPPMRLSNLGVSAIVHTLMSVVAFGLLALAFCHAILLLLQEWHLQNRRSNGFFHSLPPLETMETILFQLIGLGFSLLTVALISGGAFANDLFGQAFLFNHHVVLSIIAWLAFGALLGGRIARGWRGRTAAVWTIGSFLLLTLAYFGTRFVLEVLLKRV